MGEGGRIIYRISDSDLVWFFLAVSEKNRVY